MPPAHALADWRAPFRAHPAFRYLFAADLASQLAEGALIVALPLLVHAHTHDAALAGWAFTGEILGFGLTSPLAGQWADRHAPRRMLIACSLVRALLLLALVACAQWTGLMLLLSAGLGAAGAFFVPARVAALRRMLSGPPLEAALALEGTVGFLLRLIAPAIAGLALWVVSPGTFMRIEAGLFLLAAGLLLWLPALAPAAEGVRQDWREGFRLLRSRPELGRIIRLDCGLSVAGSAAFSVHLALLERVLHVPVQASAALLACTGLAGALGAQLGPRLSSSRLAFAGLSAVLAISYALVPLVGSLGALMAIWLARGLAVGALSVLLNVGVAREAPAEAAGRVQAAWGLLNCLACFVGSALAPWIAKAWGPAVIYAWMGLWVGGIAIALAGPRAIASWRRAV